MKGLILALICFFSVSAYATEVVFTTYNMCAIEGEIDGYSMSETKACLAEKVIKRKNKNYPIYLYINSPGGSVYDGLKFIEFAKTIPNLHTVTSFAASMAAGIVEGLPGKRYGVENNIMMFHRATGSVSGQLEDGELEVRLKLWKQIIRSMEQTNADRIGITLQDYKSRILNEWWTFGQDSISTNVLDQIVVAKCSTKLASTSRVEKVLTFFGEFEETVYDCPLLN